MYENDFFYAETPVPDVKFHVWNIQIHTSIQQRRFINALRLFYWVRVCKEIGILILKSLHRWFLIIKK